MKRDPRSDWAAELFRAARAEQPSDEARQRVRDAGASVDTALATEAEPALPFVAPPLPSVHRHDAAVARPFTYVAWFLGAAAAVALAFILHRATTEDIFISSERIPALGSGRARETAEPSAEATEASHRIPENSKPDERTGSHVSSALRAESERSAVSGPSRPKASLSDEIKELDEARKSLASGDAPGTLAKLDHYDKVLGGARLSLEAMLLRIQALSHAGRETEASVLARRFIQNNPGSPLVDRARAYVGDRGDHATGADAGGFP